MKATQVLILALLLTIGLTGLAMGRDTNASGDRRPAASYGQNNSYSKHRGRHHRRHHHDRNRGRRRHKHNGMKM
jgi:hypothetical protein